MRASRFFVALGLPTALISSCVLPSFQNVDGVAGMAGASGSAGSPVQEAGAAGDTAGEGGAAGASTLPPIELVADSFSVDQGQKLTIPAPGVLQNDAGLSLSVTGNSDADASRPKKYDGTFSVEADGSLAFEPQADFFGEYRAEYTVQDKDGQTATTQITIHVRPTAGSLATVHDGVGGFAIDGYAGDGIGAALSSAGDVNHDGFDDILIGAPSAASGAGRAYVVYGSAKSSAVTLAPLAAKSTERAFFSLDGVAGDGAGNSLAAIGDLNRDAYADFAIAASNVGAPNNPTGAVYVVYGGKLSGGIALGTLKANDGFVLSGSAAAPIGELISRAGDMNGDGIPDLLVSGNTVNGRVYGVPGAATQASTDIESVPGVTQLLGAEPIGVLPVSMDRVGNVNGDAKAEVVVASNKSVSLLLGAAKFPASNSAKDVTDAGGLSYPITAGADPLAPRAAVAGAGNVNGDEAKLDDVLICEADAGDAWTCHVVFDLPTTLAGGWPISGFGDRVRVAHGADINGDGLSDLLLADGGIVSVVFGKRSGHAAIDVTSLGKAGLRFSAEAAGAIDAIASLGDVNGDGIDDYAVGDAKANRVYVVFGEKY